MNDFVENPLELVQSVTKLYLRKTPIQERIEIETTAETQLIVTVEN